MGALDDPDRGGATSGRAYAERLLSLEGARWKRVLGVQRPYRWHLTRLHLGRTLDVGCGIGRNLRGLGPDAVGVDHNVHAIDVCRRRGLTAWTIEEFFAGSAARPEAFDALLCAHVLEHVTEPVADHLIDRCLPLVRPGGRVVLITPQEAGFRTDATHIRWVDRQVAEAHATRHGLEVERSYSFPLPRPAGKVFPYNEFVTIARVPGPSSGDDSPGVKGAGSSGPRAG